MQTFMWDVYCPDLRRCTVSAALGPIHGALLDIRFLFSSVNRWASLIVLCDSRFQATAAVNSTGKRTGKVPIEMYWFVSARLGRRLLF